MQLEFKIQNFKFLNNQLTIDENGRTMGILINYIDDQQIDTSYQEAYILATPVVDLMNIEGINLFKKFIKFNGYDFSEVEINSKNMPTYQHQPFIIDGKVMVSNKFLCDSDGKLVSNEVGGQVDADGNFILDEFGNIVPKSGYYQMGNYQFDHFIKNYVAMPILNILMFRLENRDIDI